MPTAHNKILAMKNKVKKGKENHFLGTTRANSKKKKYKSKSSTKNSKSSYSKKE
jgi:hypothetical protein